MVMCSVLMFLQTRDRIYTDISSRVSGIESKVYTLERSNNIKDKELRPYGQ